MHPDYELDDDMPTLVSGREALFLEDGPPRSSYANVLVPKPRKMPALIPPPLPFVLKRSQRVLDPESAWLASLPAAAREVLEKARRPERAWPQVARVPAAVCQPIDDLCA
jgi:hypothetical protein